MVAAKTINITLPRLHHGQRAILREARRFNVLACGRRFGKTTLGLDIAINEALAGHRVGWFAPTYKAMTDAYRELVRAIGGVVQSQNKTEGRVILITGGIVEFWTLDADRPAMGRKYHTVIFDEAAHSPNLQEAWTYSVMPTLADYEGTAWFLSTPNGQNYFYQLWKLGRDELQTQWQSWQMPTTANPHIKPTEVELQRAQVPSLIFEQEYLAHFNADAGALFPNARACVWHPPTAPEEGRTYVMGVDWAQSVDYTVLTVADDLGRVVAIKRFNKMEWHIQRQHVIDLAHAWGVDYILAEANSIGGPNIEELYHAGLNVAGFTTTAQTKPPLIQALINAVEKGAIKIPDHPILLGELDMYRQQSSPSGRPTFSAPTGGHDDTVISLALAVYAALSRPRVLFEV